MNARRTPFAADEPDHERAVVRAQVSRLDHLLPLDVPDGDLVAEAGRVDTPAAQRRRPERRADAPVRVRRHREVVHVLRRQTARLALRAGAEVAHELAGLVVELDEAARRRRVGRGSDHRGDDLPVHRHDAVRDDVAAVGDEILVQRAQPQVLPASLHVEDVDAVREQAGDDQALLVGRVAEVMELVAGLRHVDAVHDPAEVGIARVCADHGDEVGVAGALRERGDVEIPLLLRVGMAAWLCSALRGDELPAADCDSSAIANAAAIAAARPSASPRRLMAVPRIRG